MAEYKTRFRVLFDNVDFARVLYFPRQIDFFIRALEEFCTVKLGLSFKAMLDEQHVTWPTVNFNADFRASLEYEDDAEIAVTVRAIGNTSMTFAYRVTRLSDGQITCTAQHTVVMVNMTTMERMSIPDDLRRQLEPWLETER